MKTHIRVDSDGAYSLRFFMEGKSPSSILSVLSSMADRLAKSSELLTQYGTVIAEQEWKGFIEQVADTDCSSSVHSIPHHLVRKESATTPIRIVYDCSCRQSHGSPSLNYCLHAGPPSLMTSVLPSCGSDNTLSLYQQMLRMHFLDTIDQNYMRFL